MFNSIQYQQRLQKSGRPRGTGQLTHQFGGGRFFRGLGRLGGIATSSAGRKSVVKTVRVVSKGSKKSGKAAAKSAGKKKKRIQSKTAKKSKRQKPGKKAKSGGKGKSGGQKAIESPNYPLLPLGSRALVPVTPKASSLGIGKSTGKIYPVLPSGSKVPGVATKPAKTRGKFFKNPFAKRNKGPKKGKVKKPKKPKTKWQKMRNTIGKAALTGAVTSGAELGVMYGVHKLSGGATPTKQEMKEGTSHAALGIADKAIKGDVSQATVKKEAVKALGETLAKANARKNKSSVIPARTPSTILQQMKTVYEFLKAQKEARRHHLYGNKQQRIHGARAFGTGVSKGKKKGGKKKTKKKKKKGGKKSSKGRGKRGAKTMNTTAAAKRFRNFRDVFDA